jgi:hypothetical protein
MVITSIRSMVFAPAKVDCNQLGEVADTPGERGYPSAHPPPLPQFVVPRSPSIADDGGNIVGFVLDNTVLLAVATPPFNDAATFFGPIPDARVCRVNTVELALLFPAPSYARTRYAYVVFAVKPESTKEVPEPLHICTKFAHPEPEHRSSRYPAIPEPPVSVDALHDSMAPVAVTVLAVRLVGVLGGELSVKVVEVKTPFTPPIVKVVVVLVAATADDVCLTHTSWPLLTVPAIEVNEEEQPIE